MSAEPKIPFGYKLVTGPLQKGDGVWDGEKFVKARREEYYVSVKKKRWPVMLPGDGWAIRKCEVVQTESIALSAPLSLDE